MYPTPTERAADEPAPAICASDRLQRIKQLRRDAAHVIACMIATKMGLRVLEKYDKISPKLTCNVKKIGPPPGGPKSPRSAEKSGGNVTPTLPLSSPRPRRSRSSRPQRRTRRGGHTSKGRIKLFSASVSMEKSERAPSRPPTPAPPFSRGHGIAAFQRNDDSTQQ